MIALSRYKKILGQKADNLTDEEIQELLSIQYKLANFMFDIWYEKYKRK